MSEWGPGDVIALVAIVMGVGSTVLTAWWRRQDAAADRRAEDLRHAHGQAVSAVSLARRYAEDHFVVPLYGMNPTWVGLFQEPEAMDRIVGESEQQHGEVRLALRETETGHPSADVRRLARETRDQLSRLVVHTRVVVRTAREDWQGLQSVNDAMQARTEALATLVALTDALHADGEP